MNALTTDVAAAAVTAPAIALRDVRKVHGEGEGAVVALDGISIELSAGSFTAIMGPSGSGKSTFLHVAAGLDRPTSGRVRIGDIDLAGLSERRLTILRRERIGFVFQAFNLISDLNVQDNIDVPLRYRGFNGAERRRRIQQSLERVGLSARSRHYPAELSGGQQQRVAIARALAGSPRLLLADEPTGNLDTQMARGVMDLIEELHRDGATIVMVTHDPELAVRAQREVHIVDGQVVDLMAAPRLVAGAEAKS
jgi:putative ABC transport system ATP-binding protein